MTNKIFAGEPFSVVAPSTSGSTGEPSAPTGTLEAWAVLQNRVVSATEVGATGTTITAVFENGVPVQGIWNFYISEEIGGLQPGVIVAQSETIYPITRV